MSSIYRIKIIVICICLNITLSLMATPLGTGTNPAGKASITLIGYVFDTDGGGITNADVIIPEKGISVKTDNQGKYVFELFSSGTVHVEIFKEGFMPASTKTFKIAPGLSIKPPQVTLKKSLLEEVVVTGTLTPKLYSETPVKTAVASKKAIEKKGAVSLADSLEIMTGVRVENNCQNCNFNQVRINGMEGKYSQILIDGLPIVSALAGVYALEQIPAGMIEKLEVVKGGGSALYGGNAVAGVVNVITRMPQKAGSRLSFNQESINKTGNTALSFNTDYISKNFKTYASFFTNYQNRQHMDYNGDGFSDHGELKNLSIGANVTREFNRIGGKLKFGFTSIMEDRRGGNKFDLPEHFADIAEAVRTYRTDVMVGWEQTFSQTSILKFDGSFSYTKRKSYYGSEQDPNAYGDTENPVFYGTLVYNNLSSHHHNILAGISMKSDRINDTAPAYERAIDNTYTDFSLFIQDEIELLHDVATLLVGVRADKHSEIDKAIFSPRASLVYKGLNNLTVRTTFSTGFRAPQVFDEDLHITQVGGEGTLIVNSGDLSEEKSYSFTAGLDYGKQVVNKLYQFSISGFYHRLTNAFTLRETTPLPNARVFERFNSEGVKIYGLEVEAGFQLANRLELFSGWTFQQSKLDEPEPDFNSDRLFRSPDIYGSFRVEWSIPKFLDVRAEMNYTGSMKVPHFAGYIDEDRLEESDPFIVVNLSFSKELGIFNGNRISLVAGIYNLFDQYQDDLDIGVYRDAGYVYGPRFPRTYRVGFKYNF